MPKQNLERDTLLAEVQSILSRPSLTREDSARCEQLLALSDRCGERGMDLKRARLAQHEIAAGIYTPDSSGTAEAEAAFRELLRIGRKALPEHRAQSVGSDGAGGYLCPQSFRDVLTSSMFQYDETFEACDTWTSGNGTATQIPILDDGFTASAVVAENGITTEVDTVFDTIPMAKVISNRSGMIIVSMELVGDSFFDISGVIAKVAGRRFARGVGSALTTTAINGASVGATTGSSSTIAADDLLTLSAALDAAYIGNASWAMNSATLVYLRKLKASSGGQYLIPFQYDNAGNTMLWGKRVLIAPSMPAIGASKVVVLFGDFKQLLLRQVANSMKLREYREKFATIGQIGFEVFWRVDSCMLQANNASPTNTPLVALQCHS